MCFLKKYVPWENTVMKFLCYASDNPGGCCFFSYILPCKSVKDSLGLSKTQFGVLKSRHSLIEVPHTQGITPPVCLLNCSSYRGYMQSKHTYSFNFQSSPHKNKQMNKQKTTTLPPPKTYLHYFPEFFKVYKYPWCIHMCFCWSCFHGLLVVWLWMVNLGMCTKLSFMYRSTYAYNEFLT